tara:strand:- start:4865 stop:5047 length:183 start_codon:yes stop_codon:yes gene_type:complete
MGIFNTSTGKGQEFKGTSINDSRRKYTLKTSSKKKVKPVSMDEITRGNVFCAQLRKKANA